MVGKKASRNSAQDIASGRGKLGKEKPLGFFEPQGLYCWVSAGVLSSTGFRRNIISDLCALPRKISLICLHDGCAWYCYCDAIYKRLLPLS